MVFSRKFNDNRFLYTDFPDSTEGPGKNGKKSVSSASSVYQNEPPFLRNARGFSFSS